jgi:hypothetical protein
MADQLFKDLMAAAPASPAKRTRTDIPINRAIAVALWLVGAGTTYAFIAPLIGAGAPWYIAGITALVLQGALTATEWRFFNVQRAPLGLAALVLDVLLNAGGLFAPMTRIGQTPTGQMIAQAFSVTPEVSAITAFALAILGGLFLARAPEVIWAND